MITSTGYASFPSHACKRCRAFIVCISGCAALSHVETNWNGNLLQEGIYAIHRQVRQDTLCPSVSLHVSSAFSLFSYSFLLSVLVSFILFKSPLVSPPNSLSLTSALSYLCLSVCFCLSGCFSLALSISIVVFLSDSIKK